MFSHIIKAEDFAPVCDKVKASVTWSYCFSPGIGKSSHKLIIHFHGGGMSEKDWFSSQYFISQGQANTVSPLTLIKNLLPSNNGAKFFLSCGDKDQYGFFYGANTFVKLATAQGFETTWKPISDGEHCTIDVDALAKFLLE